jgi:hypothetical protein
MENRMNSFKLRLTLLLLIMSVSFSAIAAKGDYLKEKPKEIKKKKYGWHPLLKTSGTLSYANSRDVVGQADGSTWNLGYILSGQLIYLSKDGHEWKNDLGWMLNFVKTPLVDKFSKSLDNFEISSAYMYHIPKVKWIGPYGQFGLKSSILEGYMLNATTSDVVVQQIDKDGNSVGASSIYGPQEVMDLTKPFAPTVLKESLGVFVKPLSKKYANLYVQMGAGAWEIFGRNGLVIADVDSTPELEVKLIEDTVQVGGELNFSLSGSFYKSLTYGLKANFMMPIYNNADTDLSGTDLLNMDFEFKAGYKLSKYISIDYSLKAVKIPLVSDKWQIQNGFVITFNVALIEAPKETPKKKIKMCPCGKKVEPVKVEPKKEEPKVEPPKVVPPVETPTKVEPTEPAKVEPAEPAKVEPAPTTP